MESSINFNYINYINHIDNNSDSNIQKIEDEKVSKFKKIYFLIREMINKVKNFISSFIFPVSSTERRKKLQAEYIELKRNKPENIEHWNDIVVTQEWESDTRDFYEMGNQLTMNLAQKYDQNKKIHFERILCIDFLSYGKLHIFSADGPYYRYNDRAFDKEEFNNEKSLVIICYNKEKYAERNRLFLGFESSNLWYGTGVYYPDQNKPKKFAYDPINNACIYIMAKNEGDKLRTEGKISPKLLNIITKGTET